MVTINLNVNLEYWQNVQKEQEKANVRLTGATSDNNSPINESSFDVCRNYFHKYLLFDYFSNRISLPYYYNSLGR